MRLERNRKKLDTLYVLGAGASYALSYVKPRKNDRIHRSTTPLDYNFLACFKEHQKKIGWSSKSVEQLFCNWLDTTPMHEQGLEAAIIKRVSQYDFLSNIHPAKSRKKIRNEEFLNELSHLITEYLNTCKSNRSGDTKKFIEAVFPEDTHIEQYDNRIITFNYDTLIEKPLLDRKISKKQLYFDRLVSSRDDGIHRQANETSPHPLIVKLHGSINWRCDRDHFDQIVSGRVDQTKKVPIWSPNSGVPKPEDEESPLIIPPLPNKPITATSIFQFLWTVAYEYLHEAKNMVIVGYSCPPTDTLARTMFSHFNSQKLEEVVVVDPDATALKSYREMFNTNGSSKIKWRYYSTFQEYINGEL